MNINRAVVFSDQIEAYEELCAGAARLAEKSIAIVVGSEQDVETVSRYSPEVIWLGEKPEQTMIEDYAPEIAEIVKEEQAGLVLLSSGRRSRCIAGKLAVHLDAPVVTDALSVRLEEDGLYVERMVYGGAANALWKIAGGTAVLVLPVGLFEPEKNDCGSVIRKRTVVFHEDKIRCLEVKKAEMESVDLPKAKRIVSGGRGLGEQETLRLIEELAHAIGAEVGCSRPVAEELHWMAVNRYIGISGVQVKPDIYIACGISGQVQHMIGANGAKKIIAINRDENAPVFKQCDYGIVGDLKKVIPEMLSLL